jgi:hypothetical protein
VSLRRPALAWTLCVLSLALFALGIVLGWIGPEETTAGAGDRLGETISVLGFVGIPVVGGLLAARVPGNAYGWVWSGFGLLCAVAFAAGQVLTTARFPLWVPALVGNGVYVAFLGLFVFVFLLFPTGRLPGPRWRWVARGTVALTTVLLLATPSARPDGDFGPAPPWVDDGTGAQLWDLVGVGLTGLLGLSLAAVVSLLVRVRRAGPVERRQLAWFLYGALANAALVVLDVLGTYPEGVVAAVLDAAFFGMLQAAVAVAVLRYRLYEIDRIVSRTVSYAGLTGLLLAVYIGLVTLLRPLLTPVTGTSELAVAVSTLAAAAVFGPARRRVQAAVDRRFDRARYDAARAVEDYARRLRTEVDLAEVTAGLCRTVTETVGPERIGLWLREPGVPRGRPQRT